MCVRVTGRLPELKEKKKKGRKICHAAFDKNPFGIYENRKRSLSMANAIHNLILSRKGEEKEKKQQRFEYISWTGRSNDF